MVENSKSVRRNIRRSTFFQREFKVLTFLHSADKFFRNHAIDLRYFIKSRTLKKARSEALSVHELSLFATGRV